MNNIFKVIWNHATQTWTAVGELASAKGKSKSVKLAAISTALLAVAGGAQASDNTSQASAIDINNNLGIYYGGEAYEKKLEEVLKKSTPPKEFEKENKHGATANSLGGIAVGHGASAGSISGGNVGNGHIAIGLMAKAIGSNTGGNVGKDSANGQNAVVALGAYSVAVGQGSTAIGAHSVADSLNSTAVGKLAKANGDGSTSLGTNTTAQWQGTAIGNSAQATNNYAMSVGVNSKSSGYSSTAVGRSADVTGNNSVGIGTETKVNSANVTAVGSNITVGSGRDGSVVLGHGSDAGGDSVVTAVNSAKAGDTPFTYKGFAGNLGDKSKDATNSQASNQGRIVSVGDDTKKIQVTTEVSNGTKTTTTVIKNLITKEVTEIVETSTIKDGKDTITKVVNDITDPNNKKVKVPSKTEVKDTKAQPHQDSAKQVGPEQTIYGERQIQHVAAGEITAGSTNAINGSQLYQVAKTLGTAAKGLADTLGVELDEDGNLITPFKHTLNTSTSNYTGDKDASNVTTALTQLNAYVNAGWTVGNNAAEDVSKILPNGKVNFVNGEGTTSTVTANGTNGANVTFNVKKDVTANATTGLKDGGANNVLNVGKDGVSVVSGTIDKATKETKGEVKAKDAKDNQVATVKNVVDAINSAGFVVSNGKSDKSELINAGKTLTLKGGNGVNVEQEGSNFTFSIDSSTLLEGKTGNITVDEVKKAGETDAGKATVNNNDVTKLATVKNVADAINGAKWFAKVENLSDSMNVRTQNDKDAEAQAMGAGDILTLKADKNLAVKREGKDVTYGLASEIEVDKITVKAKAGETVKGTTVENGKVTNLDDHLKAPTKVTGGDVVNATEVKTPTLTDAEKKEAATVNDVLNAGWNLKTNGNQAAAITNGKGLDFASDDNSVTITPTVDKDGNAKVNFSVNATSVINNNKGTIKEAATDPKAANAGTVTVSDADKGKLATVDTVAEAINSAATFVKVADTQEVITASTADDNGVAVKSGETVTHTAGKNLKVKRDKQSITYALAQDIDVNSVKATNGVTIGSGDNATKITSDDKGLNLAGKNGAATNINNVKDADLNATSKQAVNGSQLHATNEKVANLGTTVKNLNSVVNRQAGAIDSLDRKVNKHSKQARAGIAGANAAAALPQAYTQGKAMVAAAAGTFKGQNALAVGYSRISDNGKVILKLQGNANTSGDVGAGVGVGYQW